MDEQQIKDWLGVGTVDRPLNPALLEAMTPVPWPEDDAGHLAAFEAFLDGAKGTPGHRIIFADQAAALEADAEAKAEQAAAADELARQDQAETEAP